MRLTILGKRYNLVFKPPAKMPKHPEKGKAVLGIVDFDKPTETTPIRIDNTLKGQERLDTIIHELLHAADYYKSEEWASKVGSDLARALWRLGYRKRGES